jgi:flagellar protein FlaG
MEIRPTAGVAAQPPSGNDKIAQAAAPSAATAAAPTQTAAALQQAEPAPTAEQLTDALKSINNALQVRSQDLEFSVDIESARTIVTVTDKTTHEVIRQMPTKEAMEIAKALDRLQSLLIKQTA